MRRALLVLCWCGIAEAAPTGAATRVDIDVDTSLADRLLELTCSGTKINPEDFAASQLLQDQLAHHAAFGERYDLASYVQGVQAIARCEVPQPDPFRFGTLVTRRTEMVQAISFLRNRKEQLARAASALITPYVPPGTQFKGSVVLAAASFSCGGFAKGGSFFIDVPCIAADIEEEYEAITRLVAHETYHAIQERFMPPASAEFEHVRTPEQARELLFRVLAVEGSASHVGDMLGVKGEGRYARFARREAQETFRRLEDVFKLFDYAVELLGYRAEDTPRRFADLHALTFGGRNGQPAYYVGQQMAAEISHDYGAGALACVLTLPAGYFVLAYARAFESGRRLPHSHPVAATTTEAARRLAWRHAPAEALDACLGGTNGTAASRGGHSSSQ